MKCRVCGGKMRAIVTNLPFNPSQKTIVILKELPVLQCERCSARRPSRVWRVMPTLHTCFGQECQRIIFRPRSRRA